MRIEGLPIKVPAMYESGDRSEHRGSVRNISEGRYGITMLTSRGGDAAAQGYKWSDVFVKQMAHLLDEFHTNTGMATNQGVHTDQDGTPDPGFWHGGVVKGVQKRKRITLFSGDYTGMLVL